MPVKSPIKWRGVLTVVSGILVHLFCGCYYLWGNISTYVISYFYYKGDKNATANFAVIMLPVGGLVQCFFNPIGAYLQKRYNPKIILAVGTSIMAGATFAASYVDTFLAFLGLWGGVYPAGIGICYFVPIISSWEWFPKNRGLVSGLIVAGYGFAAFIFGFMSTGIVNPDNLGTYENENGDKIFPKEVSDRVPGMIRILLIFWVSLSVLSIILIKRDPEFVQKERDRLIRLHEELE
jgi:OFA family oxalate/formate antiporter-like MFS transporter